MTIRTDITIDWEASPRVLTVLDPSTDLVLQDLVDTCRYLESLPDAMDDPALIAASGKEDLGGGVQVAITANLQNTVLAFEARPGPAFSICNIRGGNLVAVDVNGDAMFPILSTAYVQVVMAAASSATLVTTSTSGVGTPEEVRDAVWNASTAAHAIAGTFGKTVSDIKTVGDDTNSDLAAAKTVIDATKVVADDLATDLTSMLSLVETLLKYSKNRTRVDQTAKTLTIYDDDTLTPIKVFNLKDFAGIGSITEIAERMPQP